MNNHIIGDLLEYVIGGGWGSEAPDGDQNTPNYVIRSADFPSIEKGSFDGVPLRFDVLNFVNKRSLQDGDILLEISGGTKNRPTGRTVYISEKLLSSVEHAVIPASFCRLLRFKKEVVFPKYMYYLLQSWWASGGSWEFQNQSTGIANFQFKIFAEKFEVSLPPLEEQERIAGILGSLDDKIEANTRLIQIMEDYIHAVIKKISESNSFKRVAIKDLAIHEKNQELPREHVEGAIHHYSLPAYDSGKTPGVEEADSIKSNKFIIDKPCVLFSKLNPGTPRIWLVNPEGGIKSYASTEFIVLTPKENVDIANLWATCSEERISQNLADMASGTSTSHQRVRPADILNSKVLDLNDQSEIRSITSYIEALRKENLQLAETRDALIKRLIG